MLYRATLQIQVAKTFIIPVWLLVNMSNWSRVGVLLLWWERGEKKTFTNAGNMICAFQIWNFENAITYSWTLKVPVFVSWVTSTCELWMLKLYTVKWYTRQGMLVPQIRPLALKTNFLLNTSRCDTKVWRFLWQDLPSADASQIANNLSNLGQIYNREDISTDVLVNRTISQLGNIFIFTLFDAPNSLLLLIHKGKGSSTWRRWSSRA